MFPNIPIPVIGLTGPSGAGKTTAAAILAEFGCAVIDGDALAREITRPGSPVLQQLAAHFGEDILDGSGNLNRALLARRAFSCEAGRRALNEITHPAITALALEKIASIPVGTPAIIVDAAALAESELINYCDHMIVMEAAEPLRLRRIMARDGVTEAAARLRLQAQQNLQYLPQGSAGYTIIKTDGKGAALRHELYQIVEQYL